MRRVSKFVRNYIRLYGFRWLVTSPGIVVVLLRTPKVTKKPEIVHKNKKEINGRFRGAYSLVALMTGALCTFEMSVNFYIPQDSQLYTQVIQQL
jgi:hypothetical protein